MTEYKIDFDEFQTNCFWFEPKVICKQPDGNGKCNKDFCPILTEEKKIKAKKDNHVERCFSKYEKHGQAFIDDGLEIEEINKFELFTVYKDFLQAIKLDLKERRIKNGKG